MAIRDDLLQPILDSPALPEYVQELNRRFEEELKKRREFYDFITPEMKAEFINGEIIIHSPAKDWHTQAVMNLSTLMRIFVNKHKLGTVRSEKALVPFTRNDYQPDICFWGIEKTKEITPDMHLYPIPDLIVEVLSRSIRSRDKGIKKEDYEAQGVKEYWLIEPQPGKEKVEQYVRSQSGKYGKIADAKSGELHSIAILDFKIPVEAIFNEAKNLETLQQLISAG